MDIFNTLVCALSLLSLFNLNLVESSHHVFLHLQSKSKHVVDVKQQGRTGYHFQPPKHWINDPNGPMYFNGIYHLFYQYNPKGAVWGNIVWAHSVSKDLINWHALEPAIFPSKPFDQFGCWSGSATVLPGNKPVILYTGIVDSNNTQVQNFAVPANLSDPFLRHWIKPDSNPLIVADDFVNKTSFRDPTTAWMAPDGQWRITIGGRRKHRGMSFLYRSRDFFRWTKAKHPLHSMAATGNWECPDFFPVSTNGFAGLDASVIGPKVKHVFKVSLDLTRYEYYTIGTYDLESDRYVPDKDMIDGWNGLRFDYGNFYASKSFFDPSKNRRILWGWANESDSTDKDVEKGWAGIQLIPRTIVLDPSGKQLLQWPIEELESLRAENMELGNFELEQGEKVEIEQITAAQADVEVTFMFDSLDKAEPFNESWDRYDAEEICREKKSTVGGGLGPFGLATLASKKLEEFTPVFFRIFKDKDKHLVLMCSDASMSSIEEDKTKMVDGKDAYRPSFGGFVNVDLKDMKISLRSLIDNSVVESFAAGGKTVITSRVYPTMALYGDAHLYAFNNGTETIQIESLSAWSMDKPDHMNQELKD
ncbi:beta-fructofuranosidase, insoluble isoenzyme 1-like [Salvia hispanica]|uniref:beta-fructofuranosidase, insoluble isoenzyme 1-like n=1 Tax=Salvia hispanica TaxID=49212 RepID=UPI002009265A|nr:beta-fructofuranosidase, insoluble isoenzyme 1-like [Salvia hispanica]